MVDPYLMVLQWSLVVQSPLWVWLSVSTSALIVESSFSCCSLRRYVDDQPSRLLLSIPLPDIHPESNTSSGWNLEGSIHLSSVGARLDWTWIYLWKDFHVLWSSACLQFDRISWSVLSWPSLVAMVCFWFGSHQFHTHPMIREKALDQTKNILWEQRPSRARIFRCRRWNQLLVSLFPEQRTIKSSLVHQFTHRWTFQSKLLDQWHDLLQSIDSLSYLNHLLFVFQATCTRTFDWELKKRRCSQCDNAFQLPFLIGSIVCLFFVRRGFLNIEFKSVFFSFTGKNSAERNDKHWEPDTLRWWLKTFHFFLE